VHRVKALKLYYPDLTVPLEISRDVLKSTDVVHMRSHNCLIVPKVSWRSPNLLHARTCYREPIVSTTNIVIATAALL